MLSVPRYRSGAVLSWERGPDGQIAYRLAAGQGYLRLNPGTALIALQADGRRNLGQIGEALREAGITIADRAHIVLTFQQLEDCKAVEMAWHFESLGEVRHSCTGCGRSCEGHLIGPLGPSEVQRLHQQREALRVLEPDLIAGDAVIEITGEKGPEACLNTTSGHCVFFTKDRLCAIHKHFGAQAKPLHCQLFPLRVIETESGFRVGITSRCTMAHRSWRSAPPRSADQAVAALSLRRPPSDLVGLDPRTPRSFRPTPAFQRNAAQETFFLGLLEHPKLTFAELVASADGTHRAHRKPSPAYLASAAQRLRGLGTAYIHDPLDQPHTRVGGELRAFLADLRQVTAPAQWVEPPAAVRDYLVHVLRQVVYLRKTIGLGNVEIGVQVTLLGCLAAMWTVDTWTAEYADYSAEPDGRGTSDDLGVRLSIWQRMQGGGRIRDLLFSDFEAYRAHMATLG